MINKDSQRLTQNFSAWELLRLRLKWSGAFWRPNEQQLSIRLLRLLSTRL